MSEHPRTPAEAQAMNSSLGELMSEVTRDVSTLMRQELELAKAEAKESAKRAGKGAGLYGGAGYAGAMTILFLSLALMFALAAWWDSLGWAALAVAVLWGIIAAVLYFTGRKEMESVQGLPQTVDTVKQIPDALKTNEENR